ncbi:hypothetical protein IT568_04530 [bacterium]|nr:hypothetical protein [bacterium]
MQNLLKIIILFIVLNFVFSSLLSFCSDENTSGNLTGIASSDVNLEGILEEYKKFNKNGNKNLGELEAIILQKNLITEKENFRLAFSQGGELIGFNDFNQNGAFEETDKLQFKIEVDKENEKVYVSDRYNNRSFFHLDAGDLVTWWMISSMLNNQRNYYGSYRRFDDYDNYFRRQRNTFSSRSFGSSSSGSSSFFGK